ncbi:MAG: hypothetical protein LBT23_08255 [Synergistaceae bacterium]|jgi:hypothetical protein|nr:hypothetical protein [Synergistaceae bacterium]
MPRKSTNTLPDNEAINTPMSEDVVQTPPENCETLDPIDITKENDAQENGEVSVNQESHEYITLILEGAASFTGQGVIRLKKNERVTVEKGAASALLSSGLFKRV